jgi:hypothetical protein
VDNWTVVQCRIMRRAGRGTYREKAALIDAARVKASALGINYDCWEADCAGRVSGIANQTTLNAAAAIAPSARKAEPLPK